MDIRPHTGSTAHALVTFHSPEEQKIFEDSMPLFTPKGLVYAFRQFGFREYYDARKYPRRLEVSHATLGVVLAESVSRRQVTEITTEVATYLGGQLKIVAGVLVREAERLSS